MKCVKIFWHKKFTRLYLHVIVEMDIRFLKYVIPYSLELEIFTWPQKLFRNLVLETNFVKGFEISFHVVTCGNDQFGGYRCDVRLCTRFWGFCAVTRGGCCLGCLCLCGLGEEIRGWGWWRAGFWRWWWWWWWWWFRL